MGDFDFVDQPVTSRKASKSGSNLAAIIGGVIAVVAVALASAWWIRGTQVKLTLASVETQTAPEQEVLTVPLQATVEGLGKDEWSFGILSGPPGAKIDSKTGVLTWKPSEEQGPGNYTVTVAVQATGGKPHQHKTSFKVVVTEVNQPPVITPVPALKVASGEAVQLTIKAKDLDKPAQTLSYRLQHGPPGAQLDASTGILSWNAPETSAERDFPFEVLVSDGSPSGGESTLAFQIHVDAIASLRLRLVAALGEAGLKVEKSTGESPRGFSGNTAYYLVEGQPLTLLEYDNDNVASDELAQITDSGKLVFGEPANWPTKTTIHRNGALVALFGGTSPDVLKALRDKLGEPAVVAEASKMKPQAEQPIERTVQEKFVDSLAKLHEKKDLLGRSDYLGVRKLFVEVFEQQHEYTLGKLAEGDGAAFRKWLDDHSEFKEEFFIAADPEDDFVAAYKVLQSLHQKFRKTFDDYGQFAIAIALTWDQEGKIDHYDDHQRRTHSIMPKALLKAADNFEYFADMADVMQGRAQYLPWEFLVFMVNDRTPRAEREWAVENYVSRRSMFGKCYSDVPYDHEMLKTESRTCKLDGKEYSLPNIRQFGGVCAMQADFAARVGKSIGVPAEYVAGEAAGGERHAWVMWVELKQVSRSGISFSLESHGRYRGDKYYVGTLRDPQTGQTITDRELELRLQAVGLSPTAYHHAKLVMQAYPQLRDKLALKPSQEIVFLNNVIDLCPGNEAAWRYVAQLARDGKIGTDSYKLMNGMLDKLFHTFEHFPDFTWIVFDDLVQYQKNAKQRNQLYERLVVMYESADRPDLSCEARLKLSDYLLKEGRSKEVIEGLAFTIKKFPDEGRYVPRLLDKLEKICEGIKGADQVLLQFYLEFIPQIPPTRGNDPSPYCMRMLERAIAKFKSAGELDQAQTFAAQLAKLKALNQ